MIGPGGVGAVEVAFDTAAVHGSQSRTVTVYTNDPNARVLLLTLKGDVGLDVAVSRSELYTGGVTRGTPIENDVAVLSENGTRVLKLMLHVSREEQGERLRERLEVPSKRWKFNPSDLEDRKLWQKYQEAYEIMLQRCSTSHAPWHVVPSDSRSRRDAIAARLIRGELEAMKPAYPDPGYRLEQFEID